ncbi:ABC transporter substrate-binding protein [Nonomuraea sp. NPDC026600]|uniref:ABC transporter substrate-binding protein n=1 Tax=Nonomuraea sp. NPDC026600 TaxID=3155363 RepID=UPI0033D39506
MSPRRTVRTSAITLLFAATALLTGCTAGSTDSAAESGSTPHVRIAIGIDQSFAPFFVAKRQGLFKAEGVDVELVQFAVGGDGVDALATDQVQFAASSDVTSIGKLGQIPAIRALLVYEQSGDYVKVVTRSGITAPEQIKTFAVVPGLSEVSAVKYLQAKGIDPASVKFVTAGPPEIPTLVRRGDADAYVLWEPWPTKGVEQGNTIVSTTGAYGWKYSHWLMTTETWLGAHTDVAAKVARALARGADLVRSKPDVAAADTQQEAKIPLDQTLRAVKEIEFQVRDLTDADLLVYDSIAKFYLDRGKVKTKPDVKKAVLTGWYAKHGAA